MENPYRTTEVKSFRTFVRVYFLFRSDRLSCDVKIAVRNALIGYMMTYACPAWEFTADIEVLNLQHLRNKDARFACTCIFSQNYTVNKRKSYRTTSMVMFATQDRERSLTKNFNGA